MNDIVLRDMDIGDIEQVVDIEKLSFKTPWTREAFEAELTRNKCAKYRVLLRGGSVVAYGGMWLMMDESHITNIAVHPEHRGCGFGDAIMEDLIKVSRTSKMKSMTLEVRVSNLPAISLYEKYGFSNVAIRKGYYQDTGEDALIMWKYEI